MRWLPLLLSLALPFGSFAAKKPASADKFNDFHSKSLASAPLKLADSSYRKLTASPRDYSIAVLLTAMDPRFGCRLCQEFQPEWDILAKSWVKGDKNGDSRLILGTLDFSDGRDTFMSVCTPCGRPLPNRKLTRPVAGPLHGACPAVLPPNYRPSRRSFG